MKNIYKLNLVNMLVLAVLIISCTNTDTVDNQINQEISEKASNSYNLLDYTPNIYHDYFKQTTNSIGLSSLKGNPLAKYSVVKQINISNNNVKNILINNKSINSNTKSVKITEEEAQEFYGKKINFTIKKNATNNKTGKTDETSVEMYVPSQIEITNPKIESEKDLLPICSFKDFVIEWNADSNNKEGLAVVVEYFGENAIPDNATKQHVINADFIEEDNGRTVLDKKIFKEIPNLSIVNIVLLRGNVKIEELGNETYKFYAETHVRMPIILAKDLSTVVKE